MSVNSGGTTMALAVVFLKQTLGSTPQETKQQTA
jgi:hypothetical protein